MSFFFTKPKAAKRPSVPRGKGALGGATTPAMKQNATALHRLSCKGCALNNAPGICTPKMQPTLVKGGVYFLAEAPGRDEDENTGRPLTGPTGRLLRECIPDGVEELCSFDNVINCRPPGNRTPVFNEIECCRPRRWKYIEEAKPKLIVGLGAVPMHWMLESTDMAGMRGRLFAVKVGTHTCWFLPTYHPSFILRVARNKQKPLQSMMGFCLRMDIQRAFSMVDGLKKPHIDTEAEVRADIQCFDGSDSFEELLALLSATRKAPLKAIDIETKGLRPYSKDAAIMSVAFSFENTHFAFALNHPQSKWSLEQHGRLVDEVEQILKDNTTKIAHNAPFEIEWFAQWLGKEVVNHKVWECTQMQAHFLDERRGRQARGDDDNRRATYQKLDFLCKQHFGVAYKSLFKLNKKDMSKSDLGETLIYNGVDTKYTLRLWHWQNSLLKKHGLEEAYLEALPRQPAVALMQVLGVNVDQTEVKRIQKKLEDEIKTIHEEINALKVVKAFIHDKGGFNPASGPNAITIFKDYLKRREVIIKDGDKIKYSADKNVLEQIDHPLAKLIGDLRNKAKLKSTYVDGLVQGEGELIYPDGKIHTNFNTTFAETGRTSSDDPNLQNFPQRKDSWVRKQIVAPKNHLIVACDYGQLEGCTAAMCSRDKVLVKALWEDYDLHMEWAIKTAELYPEIVGGRKAMKDEKVAKKFRSLIKNKLVFPAIFGAQTDSIAGYLNMPEDVIEKLMREFWETFHGLKTWQDQLMKGYYNVGYVESPTGRRHSYPLTRNQAINHPVQSLACDIVCDAMCRLSVKASKRNEWHLHPRMNIHDDLTFFIPDNGKILEESIETIYRTMLTPPYECVNVPLSVKISVGKNWYELEEIGGFWSHKDL